MKNKERKNQAKETPPPRASSTLWSLYKEAKGYYELPLFFLLPLILTILCLLACFLFFMNASMMGLFVDDLSSDMIVTHILYKAALVIAVMRWVLSWALRVRNRSSFLPSSPTTTTTINGHHDGDDILLETDHDQRPLPSSSSSSSSAQMIIDSLMLTTFGEIMEKLPRSCRWETCAVCLNKLSMKDEVRELRNCCHVFHRECLDRWLDHDHQDHHHGHEIHKTCPLCRAPLLTPLQSQNLSFGATRSQPSWAVERLLYLFGDDLLI